VSPPAGDAPRAAMATPPSPRSFLIASAVGRRRAVALTLGGLPDLAGAAQVRAQAWPALGGRAFAAAWAEGQALSLEQAVASALEDAPAPAAGPM
jgi:hypothetical protein